MLNKFRQMSSSLGMKVFLTLLAATFILVGVMTKSGHKDCVAKVGDTCITRNDFLRTKKYLLHTLNSSPNKIDQADLNKVVLDQLIRSALLHVESNHLGLVVDKSSIAAEIAKIPAFHNQAGQFDKELFEKILAANSMTESELTQQVKQDLQSSMVSSMILPYQPSIDLIKEFHSYFEQQRRIELITVSSTPELYKPTDAEISEYYKQNKDKFTVPETRDISYIVINLERYKTEAKISDKALDEQMKTAATVTEKDSQSSVHSKEVKAAMLASKAEKDLHEQIKQAEDDLAAGSSMQQVATKYGWPIHTIATATLAGSVEAPDFIKQTLPDTFSWNQNRPSDALHPEAEPNVYYIVNVDKIHAAYIRPLESMKQEAEALVVADRQKSTLHDAALIIYNNMTAGKPLLPGNLDVHIETITVGRSGRSTLSTNLIKDIFGARNKNSYTNMHQEPGRLAFQFAIVKDIVQPEALQPSKQEVLKKQITDYMTNNIYQSLLSYLYNKYKVEVYPDAIGES